MLSRMTKINYSVCKIRKCLLSYRHFSERTMLRKKIHIYFFIRAALVGIMHFFRAVNADIYLYCVVILNQPVLYFIMNKRSISCAESELFFLIMYGLLIK